MIQRLSAKNRKVASYSELYVHVINSYQTKTVYIRREDTEIRKWDKPINV